MTGALSLAALLAEPEAGELIHVAGPSDVVWESVLVEANERALAEEGAGRLVLLTEAIPKPPWQQDALVRRVSDRGFTGLALPGAHDTDSGARRLADRLGLCLLATSRPVQLARACWMLLEARDALTLSQVRKVAQSFEYKAQDLVHLLRHVSTNLGHAMALVDSGGVIAQAGGELHDELRDAISFESWVDLCWAGDMAAASARVDSLGRPGLRLVIFGRGLDDVQLKALAVSAEVAMPAIAARILIDEVTAVNDAAVSSGLLHDFLDLRGADDSDVARRMSECGWRVWGHHLGFRMIGRTRIDPLQLYRTVTTLLSDVHAEAHTTIFGQGVSGWLSFPEGSDATRVGRTIDALRVMHAELRRSFNVATGVGSLQPGARGLAATLDEASDAARIAAGREATGWFVRIDSLGLEQLLLAWTATDTFVPAAESLLAPLREGNDDLLLTLSAYLDYESSIAATAEFLGLHRNTISHRIRRIQELLGIDMTDPEARLALHLACRAVHGTS